jgi:ABC-type nitrate/sulfonate/bicarbonate transport system substrate-binding protein
MALAIYEEAAWRTFVPSRTALALMIGLLLLSDPWPAQSAGTVAGSELSRLRISIPGLGSSSYPLIMAQKKGYFRAEGYDVELIPMSGGLAVKTLMAGEVNLTAAGTVVAIIQGAKLRLVMAFIRQLPYDLVAAPEIKRVEDLRGKKVAVADRGSVTFFVARSILQGHGLEPDRDVTILNMGRPDVRYQALVMGSVQAVVANFDGTGLLEPKGFHSVAKAGKYGKGFAGSLSVTQELLDRRPDEVVKLLRATLKGTRAYLQLRDEAIKITSEWTKITPANAAKVHDLMSQGPLAPDGFLDYETMEAVIADAREVTGVKRTVRADEVFDFRLLQRVNEELQGWRP